MSTRQLPQPRAQWWASDGTPLSGGKIYTYEPGTTTNKPTWRDAQKSVANANPVILDSRGEAVIYWDGEYKVRVTDANDTLIYEQDNYGSGEVPIHNDGASLNPNPGFERDTDGDGRPDGWTITEYEPNTIVRDTTVANVESGSAALKFTTSDGGVSGVAISELVPVSPDEFIYLTARAKTSNTALKQYVSIQWFNATRNTLGSTAAPKSDLLTSYSDITLSAKSPYSDARYAAIRIDGPNWTGTELGSTWFDECRLERNASYAEQSGELTSQRWLYVKNDTPVTISSLASSIIDSGSLEVERGDLIIVNSYAEWGKGNTAGREHNFFILSGNAEFEGNAGASSAYSPENVIYGINTSGLLKCTKSGSVTLSLEGWSDGSDATAAAGAARMAIYIQKGSVAS